LRSYYYLSNIRYDRFALEVRYLLPGYPEFGDLSSYVVVSSFFDVRVRSSLSSSSSDDRNRRRRRGAATPAAVAAPATIAAWSLSNGFGGDDDEQKGKTTELIEELGRATFAEEQDCKLVQDLIKKANDLMSSMVSAALKRPDKFMASLYYEEWNDDSVVVDMAFSNHHHHKKEEDQFASETDKDDYGLLLENDGSLPPENDQNIHSMLAKLAADTNRLFYSNYKKKK
jgi:hypothetical protein